MTGTDGDFALNIRWRLGHRAFEVVLAALIKTLGLATEQLVAGDYPALCQSMATAAQLLASATCAMHFATDFDPDIYRGEVRPTMEPPNMPPGFSGTLNQRHAEFLQRYRSFETTIKIQFGNQLETAPADISAAWKSVVKMRSKSLAAHGLVCEKFVPGGESLLEQHVRKEKDKR